MSTKEKTNIFTSYIKIVKTYFSIAVFAIFVFFIVGQLCYPSEREGFSSECEVFDVQWMRVLDNGERVPVEVPGKVEAEYGEMVTLETTVPEDVKNGEYVCFRTIWQDLYVYVGDELRIDYDTKDSRPFGTNSAMRYSFLELKEEDAGKTITYKFVSDSKYTGDMRESYIGERLAIWGHYVKVSGLRTVISIFLLLLSVFCILTCGILKIVYKKTLGLTYLAWTIFFCALWMLSEVEFRQLIFKNVSILSCYTYWSLMLISLPLLLYINDIQQGRYQKIYFGPIIYSCTMMIVGTILQVFDIVQFVSQIPLIHAGTAMSMIVVIVTNAMDLISGKMREYFSVGIGIFGLLITAILELVLYYLDNGLTLGTILGLGLMFFLVMAIIKTGQDLLKTEKKRQQAILAREAQAKFLANMSHEIRTPINAIIGMNEMILRENDNSTIEEYAYNIQSASNMLLGLVNDVLDFSKIESGQLELVEDTYHLAKLIQDEVLLLNARSAGLPISTRLEVDENIPSQLFGDELRIKQVLTNILSNAVKYTKEGSVTFKTSFEKVNQDTIMLKFTVADTGIGIHKEDMPGLFDSFKRLELNKNRNIQGTGLGLNIAKQLVDLMEGNIKVESEYGKGSTFIVEIPQKIMDNTPIGNLEVALAESRKKTDVQKTVFVAPNTSVLVVDDNSMNLTLMKRLLKRTQVNVEVAKSGAECLELTKQKKYDLIFMDHMMPEMDGVETLHRLRELPGTQDIPVVALTANAIKGTEEFYFAEGFDDFLAKPFRPEALEELILKYMSHENVIYSAEENVENVTECSESVLSDIEGIDWQYGLEHFDSVETMFDTMEELCRVMPYEAEKLQKFYDVLIMTKEDTEEAFKQYRVQTHSMKGSANLIGAVSLGAMAKELEDAARDGNQELISQKTIAFLTEWKLYEERIATAFEKQEKKALSDVSLVIDALEKLKSAFENMNVDQMDELMQEIDGYAYSTEIERSIDKLSGLVTDLEEDEGIPLINELIQEFKKYKGEQS